LAANNRAQPDGQTRAFKLAHGPLKSFAVVTRKLIRTHQGIHEKSALTAAILPHAE
jgi:hypothetical protein